MLVFDKNESNRLAWRENQRGLSENSFLHWQIETSLACIYIKLVWHAYVFKLVWHAYALN